MVRIATPENLPAMKCWSSELKQSNMDWFNIFSNLFYHLTNNNKLIQFQYKLFHRITTCRYMRHKMSIDKDSPVCSLCNCALETLPHIFLECAVTRTFLYLLRKFINSNIDRTYVDPFKYYLITCMHENGQINFINAVAKWYISNRFHNKQSLIWDGFAKQVKMFLQGEKQTNTQFLRGLFL